MPLACYLPLEGLARHLSPQSSNTPALPAVGSIWATDVPGWITGHRYRDPRRRRGLPRTVLWLSELCQYAGADGGAVVLGRVADLLDNDGCLVITTLWPGKPHLSWGNTTRRGGGTPCVTRRRVLPGRAAASTSLPCPLGRRAVAPLQATPGNRVRTTSPYGTSHRGRLTARTNSHNPYRWAPDLG